MHFQRTLYKVKKGQKNKGLDNQNIENEFTYLKNLIDFNDKYESRLLDDDDTCRYKNIRCYKDNYVKISSPHEKINASWIHLPYENSFISAQAPLKNTVDDFWTMCFDHDINTVIMLCNLEENGKEKCEKYWENKNNDKDAIVDSTELGSNFVINYTTEQINDDITIRNINIRDTEKNENNEKKIKQIHYGSWPDHKSVDLQSIYGNILFMFNLVDNEIGHNPIVVHCSAGVGRTGTFIALYNLYRDILSQIHDEKNKKITLNFMNLVRKMKEMRMHLVETEDQYNLIYQFVEKFLKDRN
jgi:protein tyrosine phosphatase